MARKTIAGLEKIIKQRDDLIEILEENYNKLINRIKEMEEEKNIVKKVDYDFLLLQMKSRESENAMYKRQIEKLRDIIENDKLKQENEELKMMCKELQKQLKEKDYLNAKVGRRKTITPEQREDIRRKYANGTSMNKLAIDYNTSKTTIHKIIKKEVNN
jgi:hypothetical protein